MTIRAENFSFGIVGLQLTVGPGYAGLPGEDDDKDL